MPLFRRMLVALAGLDSDLGLLAYAAMLARLLPGLETFAVHVFDDTVRPHPGDEIRAGLQQRVRSHTPTASCEVIAGDLLDTILDVSIARGCDLILLGHRQSSRRKRSLARRLAMKAPCSVWMIPDGSPPALSRILVPVDFSPRSADCLSIGTALAEAAGQDECTALHVYFNHATATYDEFDEVLLEDADHAFFLFVAPIDLHSVFARPMFLESANVAQAVLRVAEEQHSDLIVMGTRGRSPSAAVLLGSETEQTMIHAPVPILAVKHFGARMRLVQALRDERVRRRSDEGYY